MNVYDPPPSVRSQPYWDGVDAGELRYQECTACGHRWMAARDACPRCGSAAEWRAAAGTASVYSYSAVHRAPTPELRDRVPYVIALVDLDEGPRLMSWIVDCDPDDVTVGARAEVAFEQGPASRPLPLFRLA